MGELGVGIRRRTRRRKGPAFIYNLREDMAGRREAEHTQRE
jgi:hypothetical protein